MFSFLEKRLSKDTIFLFSVMLSIFLISCEYGVTRPASCSIFISAYSASWIPYVWIASIPINFFAICLYNRYLPRFGCWKVFLFVVSMVIIVNTTAGFFATSWSFFPFVQALCKDFYILLMFKQVWSLIHTTISSSRAKFLYGLIAGVGGVGAVLGGLAANLFAVALGSQSLFFFTLPLYLLLFSAYTMALRTSAMGEQMRILQNNEASSQKSGIALIRSSPSLVFLLSIAIFMQLSVSLIDFQFNLSLEKEFPNMDLRTQYYGRLIWIINGLTALFQFFGGWAMVHFLGLKKSHLFITLFLLCNSLLLFFVPAFGMISYALIAIKTLDYSLFGIAREMLYIPLKINEKFQAKAFIDVFASRSARALGSFLILFLQIFSSALSKTLSFVSVLIFFCWLGSVWRLFKTEEIATESPPLKKVL